MDCACSSTTLMVTDLLLLYYIILRGETKLVIKACCDSESEVCNTYETIDDLFGLACCAFTPYNTFSQLCCNGVIRDRHRGGFYVDRCCGTEVLRLDQTCCEETVHNVRDGDCCGSAIYSKMDSTYLCCNSTLSRTTTPGDICCGSSAFDGGRQQICCGNKVTDRDQADACCILNDGSEVEYLTNNQLCCNGAVAKGAGWACCYLWIDGKLAAEPYDIDTQCCRYPYDAVYPKLNDSCVDSVE